MQTRTLPASLVAALAILLAAAPASARRLFVAPTASTDSVSAGAGTGKEDGTRAHPFGDLRRALASARSLGRETGRETGEGGPGVTIQLEPGEYVLTPDAAIDSTCGNCADPSVRVPITVGLRVSGRRIRISGAPDHASVIRTNAGYGIFFEECRQCGLEGVTITGGARDTSGMATDAGVVVRRSSVEIADCLIRDNIGDSATVAKTVVGLIGIAGREGSRIRIARNRIIRNSWDGIALYRDANAEIEDNVIDGVDLAVGGRVGGGRGVGIGVTWNGEAKISGNLVRRYWKGIGLFVDARGTVSENVVEHVATWGLSLWDAEKGTPRGLFTDNAVDSTGACGVMIAAARSDSAWGAGSGALTGNAIVRTGQNPKYDSGEPYCLQVAVADHGVPRAFRIEGNAFWNNREKAGAAGSGDLGLEQFRERIGPLCSRLVLRPALAESWFLREFGGKR